MNQINALESLNALNRVNDISFQTHHTLPKINQPDKTSKSAFERFFDAAVKLLDETNQYQIRDEQLQIDYAAGRTDDIIAVTLAQQKAFSSLNFTVQVTNRIIEAYREIMRISV
jgi:flagellar hook-basal body complex protein FliE